MTISKKRSVPLVIYQEEALYRRLPPNHEKREELKKSIEARWAGYRGELALDYFLDLLPSNTYHVFEDLRLFTNGKTFQIDTLILTPQVGFIIEVKNISGTLHYEGKSRQFLRSLHDKQKKDRFQNPVAQLNRHKLQLEHWLHSHGIHDYPIIPHVAISNKATLLDLQVPPSIPITHLDEVIERIQEVFESYRHQKSFRLGEVSRSLLKSHQPYYANILAAYSIQPTHIQKGVHCSKCQQYSMVRIRQSWECTHCGNRSRKAHHQALADYFLLYGPTLTNRRCRDFLGGLSQGAASKLLKRTNLPFKGKTCSRTYLMPEEIEEWVR